MDKKVNLNVELDSNGSYVRRNNLPVKIKEDPATYAQSEQKFLQNMKMPEQFIKQSIKNDHNEQKTIEQSIKSIEQSKGEQNAGISESISPDKRDAYVPAETTEVNENQKIIDEITSRVLIRDVSPNEFYLNGKHIVINKWKVKTRSELLKCETFAERRKVLVYDNLSEFVPLDMEEFNYVLYRIRDYSYNRPIKYNLTCSECGRDYSVAYNLKDLYRPFNGFDKDVEFVHTVNNKEIKIVFTNITDKIFNEYEKLITDETDEYRVLLIDFIYHIKSINGVDVTNYEKLMSDIEQWEADIFESFFNDYNAVKFYINTENTVKCPHCLKNEVMNFDEFPNFYPDSWAL